MKLFSRKKSNVVVAILSRTRNDGDEEYLLVRMAEHHRPKKKHTEFLRHWYPPGGHVEAGESEQDALVREITEELGIRIRPIEKIAQTTTDVRGDIAHWWRCEFVSGEMYVDHTEIAEARYATRKEMDDLPLWPATKKFFERYLPVEHEE